MQCGSKQDTNKWIVYVHTNIFNGKRYVGITSRTPEQRWRNGLGYRGGSFELAINKYGWDGFTHEILFSELTEEQAKQKEIELIRAFRSNQRDFGYNLTDGGDGVSGLKHTDATRAQMSESHTGSIHSVETKQKMSESAKGNTKWLGKRHTEKTKSKISQSLLMHYEENPISAEVRVDMSVRARMAYERNPKLREHMSARRKQYFIDNPDAAQTLSQNKKEYYRNNPDAIVRLSEAHKKPVDMLDAQGVVVQTFDCLTSAQDATGVDRSSITRVCSGKQKTAGGYAWRFHID